MDVRCVLTALSINRPTPLVWLGMQQVYKDFVQTDSGLQYKDVREGSGNSPKAGDRVVIDWEGYTIGYYARIFEAKGKTKGGAFDAAVREGSMVDRLECLPGDRNTQTIHRPTDRLA